MRQGRLEIPPRFLKCCSFKCAPACQRQPTDQFLAVNERSCLEEMLSNLADALVNGIRIEPFYRFDDARVQALSAGTEISASSVCRTSSCLKVNGLSGPSELGMIIPICCALSMTVKSSSRSI